MDEANKMLDELIMNLDEIDAKEALKHIVRHLSSYVGRESSSIIKMNTPIPGFKGLLVEKLIELNCIPRRKNVAEIRLVQDYIRRYIISFKGELDEVLHNTNTIQIDVNYEKQGIFATVEIDSDRISFALDKNKIIVSERLYKDACSDYEPYEFVIDTIKGPITDEQMNQYLERVFKHWFFYGY